jgi:predicted metallopeptidase
MDLQLAPDIKRRINTLVKHLDLPHLDNKRIVCFRSHGSKARARARIWSFPRIWQMALKLKAHYCIEVLSEKFDHLKEDDQTRVLIHELMHIPKNFSGALLPHRGRGKGINHHTVENLFKRFKNNSR